MAMKYAKQGMRQSKKKTDQEGDGIMPIRLVSSSTTPTVLHRDPRHSFDRPQGQGAIHGPCHRRRTSLDNHLPNPRRLLLPSAQATPLHVRLRCLPRTGRPRLLRKGNCLTWDYLRHKQASCHTVIKTSRGKRRRFA